MSSSRTPYQGEGRVWGEFRCHQCGRAWNSGNSWANCGQKCLTCDIMIYPHHQRPLNKPDPDDDGYDSGKPHRSDLCEKCQKLGYNCRGGW